MANISFTEKLSIFENVLARVGFNENFLQEYHRAISGIRGYQSFLEMNPPNVNTPSVGSPSEGEMPTQQGGMIPQGGM